MSPTDHELPVAEPRRRRDAQASRGALLEAAAALFDERGYESTTVREIGERAGVDPALIARYFGGKEGLYLATLSELERPAFPTDPHAALRRLLAKSEGASQGLGPVPLAMVSPTLTDAVRDQVREIMRARVTEPLAAGFADRDATDPELRAELLVALALGVLLTRASASLQALAGAPLDDVLAVLEPVVAALASDGR